MVVTVTATKLVGMQGSMDIYRTYQSHLIDDSHEKNTNSSILARVMGPDGEESTRQEHSTGFKDFFQVFRKSRGAVVVVIGALVSSFGIGLTVGLVPEIVSDRFARLRYGYDGPWCADFDRVHKPTACQSGNDDAQSAASWASVALSCLSLICGPLAGSFSDKHGRRLVIATSLGITCLQTGVFLLLSLRHNMSPVWYYASNGVSGVVSYLGITFSALSDVLPPENRSSGYGLLLAGVYGGFALGPSLALFFSSTQMAVASFSLTFLATLLTLIWLKETTPTSILEENRARARDGLAHDAIDGAQEEITSMQSCVNAMMRPFREISILNNSRSLRLVAMGSFFSSMVFASDATIVIYYIEEELDVRKNDVAAMFFVLGVFGIVAQGALLQPLIGVFGEKGLLVLTFCSGVLHNLLYAMAGSKKLLCVAMIFSQITKLNFPLLSSFASQGASEQEQGRIQAALAATNAIGYALGPLSMESIYHRTRGHQGFFGSGLMFVYAASLYVAGSLLVSRIPEKASNSEDDSLTEPLVQGADVEEHQTLENE